MPLPNSELWREALVSNAVGFGRNATGGKGGELRRVTNRLDSGSGSLRDAVQTAGAAWITFGVSGTIPLASEIQVGSGKTIDGRGADVTLSGKGLRFGKRGGLGAPTVNAIVHNLKFHGCTGNAMLMISAGAQDLCIDHVTMQQMVDESVYVGCSVAGEVAPRGITLSWCKWIGQNRTNGSADKVLLISDKGLPQDAATTISLHHNHYQRMYARHPLGRHARVHSWNNFLDAPIIGVDARTDLQYLSEQDILLWNVSGSKPMVKVGAYLPDDPRGALSCKVVNPLLLNGATYQEINAAGIFAPGYPYVAEVANAALQTKIVAGAGWQNIAAPTADEQIAALTAQVTAAAATNTSQAAQLTALKSGIAAAITGLQAL